ncbi:class I SAM-dependent methyltransferase [Solirubrobacter soli]|uniref:class I SAM-dependent methyltransferase n=1 Tax=Solirubrobacter soli TaxID=363832 RepID=UPI000402ABE1|nr:class I SAM-dependent methyltransferase [Solirubrobacter soli]
MAARLSEYASLADLYEFLTPPALLTPEGNVAAFAPWLPPAPARVLDCACGIGLLAAGLAHVGYDAHASDISPDMVARTRALGVAAEVRSWDELPPSGDFDVVLCVGNSLAHARDRRVGLRAMAGALKPGGTLLVTSRNWELEQPGGTEVVERDGRRATITRVWTPGRPTRLELTVDTVTEVLTVWPFTHAELLDDLRAAGLEPTDSTHTSDCERYLLRAHVR